MSEVPDGTAQRRNTLRTAFTLPEQLELAGVNRSHVGGTSVSSRLAFGITFWSSLNFA
ncbi:hypothetical protein Hanom_Chr10g00932371 [Helianthus anomalus]